MGVPGLSGLGHACGRCVGTNRVSQVRGCVGRAVADDEVRHAALALPAVQQGAEGHPVKRIIVVPGRLANEIG